MASNIEQAKLSPVGGGRGKSRNTPFKFEHMTTSDQNVFSNNVTHKNYNYFANKSGYRKKTSPQRDQKVLNLAIISG